MTSFHLKIIALVTMIIDHIGVIFFPDILILRIIGRVSFILFAFMIVEGFFLTTNFKKYITKVGVWAILSEIPYDLAFHQKLFYFKDYNIFFSLFLALLGIFLVSKKTSIFSKIIIVLLFLSASYVLPIDYSWYGVATIFTFYFLRKKKPFDFLSIQALNMIASINVLIFQILAFIGFVPLIMYNGKQGKKTGNVFYSFYAIHLLAFATIKYFLDYKI